MPDKHDTELLAKAVGQFYKDKLPLPPLHDYGIGDVLHQFWDWWSSYTLSAFLLFYDKLDSIVSVGGFVLLIIRLIADGPRAYKTLKDYFNGK